MAIEKYTVQIGAPLEQVYALYTNLENIPKWFPDAIRVENVSASMTTPGARFTIRFQGRPNAVEEVLEVVPNKLHRRKFTQAQNRVGAWGVAAIHFRAIEGGTEVEEQVEFGFLPSFLAPIMSALLDTQARTAICSELEAFKVFAENLSQPLEIPVKPVNLFANN
jgi:uncharacterized protein YndB with AHSA1/START domain